MEAVRVDLGPLRRPATLGGILAYERIEGIPLHRRLLVLLGGAVVVAAAMVVALVWLDAAGILAQAPVAGVFAGAYAVAAAAGALWFALDAGRRAKLAAFAWVNGWAYADTLEDTDRPGSPFDRVEQGRERAVIGSDDPRLPFELGRHHSVSRGRREAATIQKPFAFVELPLPAPVPHVVLRSRRRSIIPTLGLGRGNARMELEGDFASHFTLFVPEGYERDALYIFTPDLMARVVDLGGGGELELRGRRLYLYLPRGTRFDRAEVMAKVLTIAEELHRRFAARTERYVDTSVAHLESRFGPHVGGRGQELAGGGVSVMAIAAPAAVLLLAAGVTGFALFAGALLR